MTHVSFGGWLYIYHKFECTEKRVTKYSKLAAYKKKRVIRRFGRFIYYVLENKVGRLHDQSSIII